MNKYFIFKFSEKRGDNVFGIMAANSDAAIELFLDTHQDVDFYAVYTEEQFKQVVDNINLVWSDAQHLGSEKRN